MNWKQQLETFCGRSGQPLLNSITPEIVRDSTRNERGRTAPTWYEQIRPNAPLLLRTTREAALRLEQACAGLDPVLSGCTDARVAGRVRSQLGWTRLLSCFLLSEFHACEGIVLAGPRPDHPDLEHGSFEAVRMAEAENTVRTIATIRFIGRENIHLNSGQPLGLESVIAQFEEKRESLMNSSEKTGSQIEAELGLSTGLIYRWRKALEQDGATAFPGNGNERDKELAKLRKENAELREEREILRKAIAIFSDRRRK